MIIISVGACWRNESIIPSWKLKIIWVSSSPHAVSLSVVTFKLSTLLLSLCWLCLVIFSIIISHLLVHDVISIYFFLRFPFFHFFFFCVVTSSWPELRGAKNEQRMNEKKLKQEGKLWKLFYDHDFCFHCVHIVLQTRLNLKKKKFCEK